MTSLFTPGIIFTCILGGSLLGVLVRSLLPASHLKDDSKNVIQTGVGLISTMAALVLGLLVASAKGSFDSQKQDLTRMSADYRAGSHSGAIWA